MTTYKGKYNTYRITKQVYGNGKELYICELKNVKSTRYILIPMIFLADACLLTSDSLVGHIFGFVILPFVLFLLYALLFSKSFNWEICGSDFYDKDEPCHFETFDTAKSKIDLFISREETQYDKNKAETIIKEIPL